MNEPYHRSRIGRPWQRYLPVSVCSRRGASKRLRSVEGDNGEAVISTALC